MSVFLFAYFFAGFGVLPQPYGRYPELFRFPVVNAALMVSSFAAVFAPALAGGFFLCVTKVAKVCKVILGCHILSLLFDV
jgi:hypothetical protein